MDKLIVIRLEEGSFKNGFQVVNLQIAEDGKPFHHQPKTSSLPANAALDEFYENLKKCYEELEKTSYNYETLSTLYSQYNLSSDHFQQILNNWLKSSDFDTKWEKICGYFTKDDYIRVVLQIKDQDLAKLPWHLWNFFDNYPLAEVAFSLSEYEVKPCYHLHNTEVRILVIDGGRVDSSIDKEEIQKLSPDATLLKQPDVDVDTIVQKLEEEEWDILFFVGHSTTSDNKGILHIEKQGQVTIDKFKNAVNKALSKRLRLAIFNSCHGLGLATTLARWNFPQVIVMRLPISTPAAHRFIESFIPAFQQDKTLYLALRDARDKLQELEENDSNEKSILASWLPVIYDQAFVQRPLTWQSLPMTRVKPPEPPYIERPPLEQTCYDAIVKPGGLIRITAPQKMGKTLLLNKVLSKVIKNLEYKTVILKCDDFSTDDLENNAAFFRSFCSAVSIKLKLEDKTCEYWEKRYPSVGDILKASLYFEEYLLCTITHNLVLALDNFESLFSKLHIFEEFCRFLRNSHEKSAQPDEEHLLWEKLRLVIVNSTEKYPELDDNCSPFKGVGNDINERVGLQNFTENQVKQLLENAQIDTKVSEQNLSSLMDLVKGHPYLIKQAFDYLKQDKGNSLDKILDDKADLEQGIFGDYLKKQLNSLKINSNLIAAYKTVILTSEPVRIDDEKFRFQLHSLGLIKLIDGDHNCVVGCDLYRRYFSKYFQINLDNNPI
jgi:hypothetical protein